MKRPPKTIDAYLTTVKGERRKALEALRTTLRSLLPGAEETISYGIPAFRLEGRVVAGFLARRDGCSYLPFSGTTLATLASELEGYQRTKSSLHFDAPRGLPKAVVRKLVKARLAED
jgi:uncharacterized protein YdhG (YjbR/CyaY superfamily)